MTPNRLTFINIKSVSLTVGVLLFHLYIKIKRTELNCPVLYILEIFKLQITCKEHSTHLLSEFLPMVRIES